MGMIGVLSVLVGIVAAAQGGTYDPESAYAGQIPYQTGIFKMTKGLVTDNIQYGLVCSGALISNEFVLTTATCVNDLEDSEIAVSAGFLNIYDKNNTYINVTEVITHLLYVPGEAERDIALLKISPGFPTSELLSPVLIQEDSTMTTTGTECTVSGWKRDFITLNSGLLYSKVLVKEQSECTYISSGEICAGAPSGELICQLGDGGSPIVCNGLLTGVMHYSTASCLSEPGVFCDVAYHKDWIRSYVDLDSVSTTSSTTTTTTVQSPTTTTPAGVYETVIAEIGDVPYQAAVGMLRENLLTDGYSFSFGCGGTVVDQQFVLTTVRCAEQAASNDEQLTVAGGFVKLYADDVDYHNVTQVIRHPDYSSTTGDNDIALLRVTPDFTLSATLSIIALRDDSVATGSTCKVSGWKEDLLTVNPVLKYGSLLTTQCEDSDNEVAGSATSRQVCGGIPDEGSISCLLGDEGAPLVCNDLLAGLFHNTFDSCLYHTVGKYHDLAPYKQWIVEQIATPLPSTTEPTTETSTTVDQSVTTTQPQTTILSTSDHTTGVVYGGAEKSFSSSIVAIVLLSVMTFLNVK